MKKIFISFCLFFIFTSFAHAKICRRGTVPIYDADKGVKHVLDMAKVLNPHKMITIPIGRYLTASDGPNQVSVSYKKIIQKKQSKFLSQIEALAKKWFEGNHQHNDMAIRNQAFIYNAIRRAYIDQMKSDEAIARFERSRIDNKSPKYNELVIGSKNNKTMPTSDEKEARKLQVKIREDMYVNSQLQLEELSDKSTVGIFVNKNDRQGSPTAGEDTIFYNHKDDRIVICTDNSSSEEFADYSKGGSLQDNTLPGNADRFVGIHGSKKKSRGKEDR